MKNMTILTVGSLVAPHWKAAAQHYTKRIQHTARLRITHIKDAAPKLLPQAKSADESQRLMRHISPKDVLICLDDKGKQFVSEDFAALLEGYYNYGESPCFVIGGAYGLSKEIKNSARHLLSLGKATLPHELALVVLLEQIYRTETIILGTGYHHG